MLAPFQYWRVTLAVTVGISLASAGSLAKSQSHTGSMPKAPLSAQYSLDFSQISSGASLSGSVHYQAEEVISVACARQPVQSGGAYSVSNVVGEKEEQAATGAAWVVY